MLVKQVLNKKNNEINLMGFIIEQGPLKSEDNNRF
jgi:hypothetical protein